MWYDMYWRNVNVAHVKNMFGLLSRFDLLYFFFYFLWRHLHSQRLLSSFTYSLPSSIPPSSHLSLQSIHCIYFLKSHNNREIGSNWLNLFLQWFSQSRPIPNILWNLEMLSNLQNISTIPIFRGGMHDNFNNHCIRMHRNIPIQRHLSEPKSVKSKFQCFHSYFWKANMCYSNQASPTEPSHWNWMISTVRLRFWQRRRQEFIQLLVQITSQ